MTAAVDARGVATSFEYDPMGRLARVETSLGTVTAFSYDPVGNLIAMDDSAGRAEYTYDDLDRLVTVVRSNKDVPGGEDDLTVAYEYDPAGRRTATVYPGGARIEYAYDPAGRLTGVTNAGAGETTLYDYDNATGLLTSVERPNGVRTEYSFDAAARLTDIRHETTGSGALIALIHYELNTDGQRAELHVTRPDLHTPNPADTLTRKEKYTYDAPGRLIEAIYSDDDVFDPTDRAVAYTYDGNGARTTLTVTRNGGVVEERRYTYGNDNRLLRVTNGSGGMVAEYAYDAAGARIMKVTPSETVRYTYDAGNLLTRIETGHDLIEYGYDGAGHRIARRVNGVETRFVVDTARGVDQVLEERDGDGNVVARHIHGLERLSVRDGGRERWLLGDGLGSVHRWVDGNGTAGESYAYDVFGNVTSGPNDANEWLFTGERTDPVSGLIHLRARYYDPETGRFVSRDPIGVLGGVNCYAYGRNNPVNFTDPAGLDVVDKLFDLTFDHLPGNSKFAKRIKKFKGTLKSGVKIGMGAYSVIKLDPSKIDPAKAQELFKSLGLDIFEGYTSVVSETLSLYGDKPQFAGKWISLASQLSIAAMTKGGGKFLGGPVLTAALSGYEIGAPWAKIWPDNWLTLGVEWYSDKLFFNEPEPTSFDLNEYDYGLGSPDSFKDAHWADNKPPGPPPPGGGVGGVMIHKAAEYIGGNLSDIVGAAYDPNSHQIIFLGSDDETAATDIDMDYFHTAIKSVHGSTTPPSVSLDPPADMGPGFEDMGDGDKIFEDGESGGFLIQYTPLWRTVDDDMRVVFRLYWGEESHYVTGFLDAVEDAETGGVRFDFSHWEGLPDGLFLQSFTSLYSFVDPDGGQNSGYMMIMRNESGRSFMLDALGVIPALQHRRFGGRVEGSRLGWVMLEADRVIKCLGVGIDHLTGAVYDSSTAPVPGYRNLLERKMYGGHRFWLTPNEMTLDRHVDPASGRATIVFDKASVALLTEEMFRGHDDDTAAREFADHFTANYDLFAALEWPVFDPGDPSGETIIHVKIFEQLREAMQAVSVARFFKDNDIPLDAWWLASWEPPAAHTRRTVPTAVNEEDQTGHRILLHGGVEINRPNDYAAAASAASVGAAAISQRPAGAGDLGAQAWGVSGTAVGELTAAAASIDHRRQDGNIRLAAVDLDFESPGAERLRAVRFYNSGYAGQSGLGPGWRSVRFALEFSQPSWRYDDQRSDGMRNLTPILSELSPELVPDRTEPWSDDAGDTRLRSGEIRFVDHASGRILDFRSSLTIQYDLATRQTSISGLSANELPDFTPGQWDDGSRLEQMDDEKREYRLTFPDGGQLTFDYEGRLTSTSDRHGRGLDYTLTANGYPERITDDAGRSLVYDHDPGTGHPIGDRPHGAPGPLWIRRPGTADPGNGRPYRRRHAIHLQRRRSTCLPDHLRRRHPDDQRHGSPGSRHPPDRPSGQCCRIRLRRRRGHRPRRPRSGPGSSTPRTG